MSSLGVIKQKFGSDMVSTLGINFDNNNTIQAEFEYKANLAMFAGYPSSPSSIVYWSCNSQTKSTLVSHNVI
jgi:hypothetical protein